MNLAKAGSLCETILTLQPAVYLEDLADLLNVTFSDRLGFRQCDHCGIFSHCAIWSTEPYRIQISSAEGSWSGVALYVAYGLSAIAIPFTGPQQPGS